MSKGKRNREARRANSTLGDHKQHKKELRPPLMQFHNLEAWNWKERLPDMLWISALIEAYPGDWRILDRALDPLDQSMPPDSPILDGRLTRLDGVPESARAGVRAALAVCSPPTVLEDLACGLSLFDDAPGAWALTALNLPDDREDKGLAFLRQHIDLLSDTRGLHAEHARMIALWRYFKHGKLVLSSSLATAELLPKYPSGLDEAERQQVRTMTRMYFDMLASHVQENPDLAARETRWAEQFWQRCARLAGAS